MSVREPVPGTKAAAAADASALGAGLAAAGSVLWAAGGVLCAAGGVLWAGFAAAGATPCGLGADDFAPGGGAVASLLRILAAGGSALWAKGAARMMPKAARRKDRNRCDALPGADIEAAAARPQARMNAAGRAGGEEEITGRK
jgi:hypothetical protein